MAKLFARFDPTQYLPYQSRFLEIDGVRLHYFDEGPRGAEAVLLLHGNPTWSFYFRNLIQALSKSHRVIAPDFIGCGLSDHPVDRHYRARDRVAHLGALLDHCGVTRFSAVMHDWGGPIGTRLAEERADAVQRLVYLNTTLTETEHLPAFIRLAAHPWVGKFITQRTTRFLRLMLRFGVCRPLPTDIQRGYLFPYSSSSRRSAIWDFVQDIPFTDAHPSYLALQEMAELLPRLRSKPVLIFWGLRDPCFHRGMLNQVCRHFPQAEVVEVADASHLVLEDANELACRKIAEFLQPVATSTGETALESMGTRMEGAHKPSSVDAFHEGSSLYARAARCAKKFPDRPAVITVGDVLSASALVGPQTGEPLRSARMSFRELFDRIRQYERGLVEIGLQRGDRIVMLVPPGIDFLALSYALMGRGAVPVFLDPGMGRDNLARCIADANPQGFIGSPKAHLLRFFNRTAFRSLRFSVAVGEIPIPGARGIGLLKRFSSQPLPGVASEPDDTALIAFTSGATGTPKGVLFTNRMLEAQLSIFEQSLGMEPGSLDLPLLPIFSLFSLGLGIGSVFTPMDPARPLSLDPALLTRVIEEFGVRSSFGSPTLWSKISEYCLRNHLTFKSLQRVYMAGAPVPPKVLTQVQRVVPHGVVATPYGATEALPVTMVRAEELGHCVSAVTGEEGTPVGKPVPGVEVRIVRASSEAIATFADAVPLLPGEIGEVVVRGENVSAGYLHRPDADRASKIIDGDSRWHRMGDTGYLDSEGRLYFCGRKVHAVQTSARIYYTDPVERIFNEHGKVRRSALIAVGNGDQPAVAIEPLPEHFPMDSQARNDFAEELRALAQRSPLTAQIEKFYFHPSFPVDARHNAKIFRDRLSSWAIEHSDEAA